MNGVKSLVRALAVPVLIGFLASGCAVGRSVLDVKVPEATASDTGKAVKIVEVRDLRTFDVNPNDPSQPSIGNSNEVNDPSITAHAIGRKRNGWGNAMGDYVLPPDKTAASIVREAVRTALVRRGYRIVDEGSPDYAAALPLAVGVNQFWAWMKPGFAEITLSLESKVTLTGKELVGTEPVVVIGHYSKGTAAGFESVWIGMIEAGIAELVDKIQERLPSSSGVAGVPAAVTPLAQADSGS